MRWRTPTLRLGLSTPPRPAAVLGAVVAAGALAACGAASHDNPAFSGAPGPAVTAGPPTPVEGGTPSISQVGGGPVATPHLAGAPGAAAINPALGAVAAGLGSGHGSCRVATTRADAEVVSFRWTCADRTVATATFSVPTGRRLTLDGVLRGAYLPYLASTAQAQLVAGGASAGEAAAVAAPSAAAFSRWGLAPGALTVTFPLRSGPATVAYPVGTLAPYAAPGAPLR